MKFLVVVLLLFTAACSRPTEDGTAGLVSRTNCPSPLVVLPDNYIVELAAGEIVELNPSRQQFALFCTVDEAREAMESDLEAGRIEGKGRWRIYSLNGDYEQLARPCGEGQACLGSPATLLEWVE